MVSHNLKRFHHHQPCSLRGSLLWGMLGALFSTSSHRMSSRRNHSNASFSVIDGRLNAAVDMVIWHRSDLVSQARLQPPGQTTPIPLNCEENVKHILSTVPERLRLGCAPRGLPLGVEQTTLPRHGGQHIANDHQPLIPCRSGASALLAFNHQQLVQLPHLQASPDLVIPSQIPLTNTRRLGGTFISSRRA